MLPTTPIKLGSIKTYSSGFRPILKALKTEMAAAVASLHTKARSIEYMGGVNRFLVPDDTVKWSVEWGQYTPTQYTAPVVLKGPVWADPDIT